MALFVCQMSRFERILFRIALALAAVIVAVRIGAVLLVWYLRHVH